MRILFIGDVYAAPGREMVELHLQKLKQEYRPQVVIANGENSAHGKGITDKIYRRFLELGINVITMGNHTFDNREIYSFIDDAKYLVRPANMYKNAPGKDYVVYRCNQTKVAVVNLQGKTFMQTYSCPFAKIDELLPEIQKEADIIFVDFHAETTSEKIAMSWYLDGRVAAVIGTHTHVQTNDGRILPKGTAHLSDVGMTGPRDGVIGVTRETILERFTTGMSDRFTVATGPRQLSYAVIDIDDKTGKATKINWDIIAEETSF
ncbi:MAG: TIGR00282 family metallophosphoesterase [Culicoidibacterales bacterium]